MKFEFTEDIKGSLDRSYCLIVWDRYGDYTRPPSIHILKRYQEKPIEIIDGKDIPASFASMMHQVRAFGIIRPLCDCCQHKVRCLVDPEAETVFTLR